MGDVPMGLVIDIITLRLAGHTYRDIGQAVGVSTEVARGVVYDWVRDNRPKPRPEPPALSEVL